MLRDTKTQLLRVLSICLCFDVLAVLAEQVAYRFAPFYLGAINLFYTTLIDLLAFLALGAVAILISLFVPRIRPDKATLFLCAALFAMDGGSILVAPYHKVALLGAGAVFGSSVTYVYSSLEQKAFLKPAAAVALAYISFYFCLVPVWNAIAEWRLVSGPQRADDPNFLVIIVDALRADHLSAYGYSRQTSPNLDRLASRGVVFDRAVAPSSWTLPSHASLLTGRLESEHHAGDSKAFLDDHLPVISSAFQQMGYRTAAFSGNSWVFDRRLGFGRGFVHFEDGSVVEKLLQTNLGKHLLNQLGRWRLADIALGRQNARVITDHASHWISKSQKPFFVVINYFDVHAPYMPSQEFMRRFSPREPLRGQAFWPLDIHLEPQQLNDQIDAYDACILFTDAEISELLDRLRQGGYLNNTIVVVTSDHGEAFNEEGFIFHGQALYWNLIHVPLVIYAPGRIPPRRIGTPVSLVSLPTTLLDLAHASTKDYPWPSLQPFWQSASSQPQQKWPAPVSELDWIGESEIFPSHYGPMRSVVTMAWHYIEGGKLGAELYRCCGTENLEQNLLPTAAGKEVQAFFRSAEAAGSPVALDVNTVQPTRLAAGSLQGAPAPRSKPSRPVNQMNEALRALGYVR